MAVLPAVMIAGEVHQNREGVGRWRLADRLPPSKYTQQGTLKKILSFASVARHQVRGAKQPGRCRSDKAIELMISRPAVAAPLSAHNP
jgi:hypothetical protein